MEADHPAVVEEVAAAIASNRMRTRKQLIFIKSQRKLFVFSLAFCIGNKNKPPAMPRFYKAV